METNVKIYGMHEKQGAVRMKQIKSEDNGTQQQKI